MTTIVWFRRDLRLGDNPALDAALSLRRPIIPVYIFDDFQAGEWSLGGASRWWLHGSLSALASEIKACGNQLIFKAGSVETIISELLLETGAASVYWNRCYEPWQVSRDKTIKCEIKILGLNVKSFNGSLLHEPWEVSKSDGTPFIIAEVSKKHN